MHQLVGSMLLAAFAAETYAHGTALKGYELKH
jgi:hypothetical protein